MCPPTTTDMWHFTSGYNVTPNPNVQTMRKQLYDTAVGVSGRLVQLGSHEAREDSVTSSSPAIRTLSRWTDEHQHGSGVLPFDGIQWTRRSVFVCCGPA